MEEETKVEAHHLSGAEILHNFVVGGQEFINQTSEYWKLASDWMEFNYQVGQECFDIILQQASIAMGKDPMAGRTAWHKLRSKSAAISSHVWEYAKPYVNDFIPEERNPFWVWCAILLAICFAIVGLRMDVKNHGVEKVSVMPSIPTLNHISLKVLPSRISITPLPPPPPPPPPPLTVTRSLSPPMRVQSALEVQLPDGRSIAYREQGCSPEEAKHTILVVHGFPSSRLAGIMGMKDELLKEFGIRLVAYDRPGFGESDPHPRRSMRTCAQDMGHIANALQFGEKFWVLGHSLGGIYVWAAMKYIPERLAGAVMFAPSGNFYARNMTREERLKVWQALDFRRKLTLMTARWLPALVPTFLRWTLLGNVENFNNDLASIVGQKDQDLFRQDRFLQKLDMDVIESIKQGNAATLAEDVIAQAHDWGFHLSDLRMRRRGRSAGILGWLESFYKKAEEGWEGFAEPIHIWQGMDDKVVPLAINEFAKRMVPQANLHRLDGEGHFSFFFFCDPCHRQIFETMLGPIQHPKAEVKVELNLHDSDNSLIRNPL